MEYKNSIIEQIGNTPLIKLNRINKGLKPQIFAKLELLRFFKKVDER